MSTFLIEHPVFSFSSELPYNTGLVVLRGESLRPNRTTVVVGTPRGGTTMVAECLDVLGLPLGVPLLAAQELPNYEDPELQAVLHRTEPGPVDLVKLRDLVLFRNQQYAHWGFKLPMALNSLALLEHELRHPAFVIVMRDVVGIASRECIAVAIDVTTAMRRAMIWQQRMIDFVESSSAPCLLISYEKALQFPDLVATTLTQWAGLDGDPELSRRAAACIAANRESYLRLVRADCDKGGVLPPQSWTPTP